MTKRKKTSVFSGRLRGRPWKHQDMTEASEEGLQVITAAETEPWCVRQPYGGPTMKVSKLYLASHIS